MPPETATAAAAAHALVLNADYRPLKVVDWQTAILLVLDEKAEIVSDYVGRFIRSASSALKWPAVIRLRKHVQRMSRMRFNRQNVIARDGFACAYCGVRPVTRSGKPDMDRLTLDHVIPRSHARDGFVTTSSGKRVHVTGWLNAVSACEPCNARKADRTPEQAGMVLLRQPRVPGGVDVLVATLRRVSVPAEWQDWLPTPAPLGAQAPVLAPAPA